MKKPYSILIALILFLIPSVNFAQSPPDLGAAASFALFTAAGAFSNDGNTVVTGDIGTNVGAFSGFPPGIVNGEINVADITSALAAVDVLLAYSYLAGLMCDQVLGTTLGGGQILTPGVYCLGAASTINGTLTLDGQGDPNSIFVIKIDGALSTTTLSEIDLINGASACNVYFQVNGEVELGVSSVFQGTILANGAISLLDGASLNGRALSQAGAISLHNNTVTLSEQSVAPAISTNGGATTFCEGGSVVISGNTGGTFNTGETTSSITVTSSGDYFVINSDGCGSDTSNHIVVTVNDCTTDCAAPTVFTIDSISAAEAQICFNSIPGALGYIVAWRTVPQTDWIISTVIAPDTCLIFTNHFPDVYEIEIATICANGDTSAFGPIFTYQTFASCTKPQNPYTSAITATKATLNWSSVSDADKYVVYYRPTGTTTWTKKTISKTFLTVKNLMPSTQYEWKVQSKCIGTTRSVGGKFTGLQYFTTLSLKVDGSITTVEITDVHVYPNPLSQQFTFEFEANGTGTFSVTIENILGRIIYNAQPEQYSGAVKKQIELGVVADGMYILHLNIDGKIYTQRLVVQHSD
ncbi:MAG: ice-binding family protein [Chitinophagales bacterium]